MQPPVPASTPIRCSRVGNVDTDRLIRRAEFLHAMADGGFRDMPTRRPFVQRAAEMFAIENEIDRREVPFFRRRTLTRAQCDAMTAA